MTIYVKCVQQGDDFKQIPWHPWINCKTSDAEIMPSMAAHKWFRERGGVLPGKVAIVDVFTYDESTPKNSNGEPTECIKTTFKFSSRIPNDGIA